MKKGRVVRNGVVLEEHEDATIMFLSEQGCDVELIPPRNIEGVNTPDIKMGGACWEMKSPRGKGRWLIENTLQRAVKQSNNVVIDLRRIKIGQTKCLRELKRQFEHSRGLKNLRVITKAGEVIDFMK